jgi:carboxyl-terminal processing protease
MLSMNNSIKNFSYIFISLAVILVLFGGGYYIGRADEKKSAFSATKNDVAVEIDGIDFSTFLQVWKTIDEKFVPANSNEEITNEKKMMGAIRGMVNAFNDPYTVFLDPEESKAFESSVSGNFEGVGMEIGIQDNSLTVIAPLKDTPAEKAGIMKGDKIIAINGETTQNMKVEEAIKLIRGKEGTMVDLKIYRESAKESIDFSIKRGVINIPTLDFEIKDDVFIISLYSFNANATSEFKKAMRAFTNSKKDKLILDLRGNPGGFLEASIDIASYFLPQGKIILKEDFGDDNSKLFRSKGYGSLGENVKMIILVDQGSASASEIVAGALQYHEVAKILGENTFGKGSVQELLSIAPNASLKVTIARWLTPGDKSISDGGLEPDYKVEYVATDNHSDEFEDNQLQEAIKILKSN